MHVHADPSLGVAIFKALVFCLNSPSSPLSLYTMCENEYSCRLRVRYKFN